MSTTRFAASTAALLLIFPASAFAQATAEPRGAMTVTWLDGGATDTPKSSGEGRPLARGDLVHEGDAIETAPGGRLEITIGTGTILRIGESSRVELRAAALGGTTFRARLLLGNFWAKVHKLVAGDSFEVETQNAVAGVRGTEFRVEAGSGGSADLVRVYEGTVVCQGREGGWSRSLTANRELRITHGKAVGAAATFDPASEAKHPFMSWVRERRGAQEGAPQVKPGEKAHPHERKEDDRKEEKKDRRRGRR